MKKLILDNYYWVLRYNELPLNNNENMFDKLHYCMLFSIVHGCGCKKYIFKSMNDFMFDIVVEHLVPYLVFETKDDFLVCLVRHLNGSKYIKCIIDNYMKNKIEESRMKYPEKWI